ncbi:MAG: ribosome biogenesis GTPase Der [Planctomycetes bacterium]|nr:ribosome biogenesis GTPase Der [Planctomycetota bacterium]
MGVPQVVIVGRPNVGKSSLFNWLAGRRLAIVDDRAGVTRDRVTQLVEYDDRFVELVDTGGIGIVDADNLTEHVERQIQIAIDSADVILFVVDTRAGLTPMDSDISQRLRNVPAPVICVANKADAPSLDVQADEFYKLGRDPIIRVSAREKRNRDELWSAVFAALPKQVDEETPADPVMKVAIVGRRNVGKSTFVNTLSQTERMIVSEVPGTTRDSVDVRFELDGQAMMAIDTPGLRKRKSLANDLEYYSLHRAQRSIRRADVVFMFFDAAEPVSQVDQQLCAYIDENSKPCVFVVNKWDLYTGKVSTEEWAQYLHDEFRTMRHVPIAFITGQTGKNIKALVNHGQMLFKQARTRVTTGELNRVLRAVIERNPPPLYKNRRPKIYYATQVGIEPPTIVLFCSDPSAISPNYQRYLIGALRERLPYAEVPIKLYTRSRSADGAEKRPKEPPLFDDQAVPVAKRRKGEAADAEIPLPTDWQEDADADFDELPDDEE